MGSRDERAGGVAVPVLILVVLFGLFTLHVLTAHGSSHHQGPTTLAAGSVHSTPHGASHHAEPAHGGADTPPAPGAALADPDPSSSRPMAGLVRSVSMGTPAPTTGGDLMMCWLLLTAGLILVIGLLRTRSAAADTSDGSPGMSCSGRVPRAPPGRQRLHQLTVLRV